MVTGVANGNATRESWRSFIVGEAFNSIVGACEQGALRSGGILCDLEGLCWC